MEKEVLSNEFIPREEAVDLKFLSFDEECLGFYKKNGGFQNQFDFEDNTFVVQNSKINPLKAECAAPLYSQAFRFIREKYNIYHEIRIGHDEDKIWWNGYIFKIEKGYEYDPINIETITSNNYEETELDILKELIKLAKKI